MSRKKGKSGLVLGGIIVGLIALMALAMVLGSKEKTLDFRGEVKKITKNDSAVTFTVDLDEIDATYTVIANDKTSIKSAHGDHSHDLKVSEIKVGDKIEGNFADKDKGTAKTITVLEK